MHSQKGKQRGRCYLLIMHVALLQQQIRLSYEELIIVHPSVPKTLAQKSQEELAYGYSIF